MTITLSFPKAQLCYKATKGGKVLSIFSRDLGREATSKHIQHKNQTLMHLILNGASIICKLNLKEMGESWSSF
jgi:hypothetical protein